MNIYLDDSASKQSLIPFSLTNHVADLRIGILTIREKWLKLVPGIEIPDNAAGDCITIPAAIIPSLKNVDSILHLAKKNALDDESLNDARLVYGWHIFQLNKQAICDDYELLTKGKESEPIPDSVIISGSSIFIEQGAQLRNCILNAESGPIYIGKNAEIMEGAIIRGPVAICEGATVKMSTRIYAATTIGPYCVAGGEIKNTMMMGFSNKAHDGYLGDSVLGYWCNLGAGTSNSNVKNTGGEVRYTLSAGLQKISAGHKAGLLMGDYSRAAINTSFNTGTCIGVCCNIFGNEMPGTSMPSFTWGAEKYNLEKAYRDIENWKKMKGSHLTAKEKQILYQLYQQEL